MSFGRPGDGELAGDAPGHCPLDEGDDGPVQGRVINDPAVQVVLGGVLQGDLVRVQPGHEVDGGLDVPDVPDVAVRGQGGVAAAGRAPSGVADDVPLAECPDHPGLVRRESADGVGQPEFQAGQVLVSAGQNAGRDEQAAKVAGGAVLGQCIQRLMGDLALLGGEFGEDFRAAAAALPLRCGVGRHEAPLEPCGRRDRGGGPARDGGRLPRSDRAPRTRRMTHW